MSEQFSALNEILGRAAKHDGMTQEARLIFMGRVSYAVECGDLPPNEADALLNQLEPGMKARYGCDLEIAVYGMTDEAYQKELVRG